MVTKKEIELSILDFGESDNSNEYIHNVIDYAVTGEKLGFKRFWMGEHYIKNSLFCNPEPLIPAIAMKTENIFVGTAGLLARQHSIERLACSFSLLEKMFPERIDLGLVAPTISLNSDGNTDNRKSTTEIFSEFIHLFNDGSESLGIYKRTSPMLWHLTTSIKNYISSQHDWTVNLSKSLFHVNSNFDPELDDMKILRERCFEEKCCTPMITIAVACFVSYRKKKINECREFHKRFFSKNLYNTCIIETPDLFLDKIMQLSNKYQTNDIIILNLARSYEEKTECLEAISGILKLQDAYLPK